jgi:hypothetical protein
MANCFFIKNFGSFGAAVSICTIYFIVLIITLLFVYKQVMLLLGIKRLPKPAINND